LNAGLSPAGDSTDGQEIQLTLDELQLNTADTSSLQTDFTEVSPTSYLQSSENNSVKEASKFGFEGDPCPECGQFTLVSNGSCLKCVSCGSTTGCS
jgi:ribonucleoside-diphosphate reductase alpha chain